MDVFLRRRFGLQHSDVILALFVVAIAGMLLVPLPTPLLDVLLVINISFSLLLLMVGLYMPNALALLAFPSILLLTTLFRLGLNVASTRLILSQADAGRVIESFGTFLIRGEIVVGVLIFAIITIVNYIVIAKGASRVSEVAARFALDAMPGKQMAIDSDLRAGLISPREAEIRREELRKESQLFGSMDGAMKFVQGDAIAGFFIIAVNIIGGLVIGIQNGLPLGEAIETYTILTVGDGLVSQVPALLISICAGIVVTRVASSDDSTLGSDVGSQVFRRPGSVLFAGVLLLGIALLPGLPGIPFTIVGLAFVTTGYVISRGSRLAGSSGTFDLESTLLAGPRNDLSKDASFRAADAPLVLSLEGGGLIRLYQQNAERYDRWWAQLRDDFYDVVGIRLPDLVVVPDRSLPSLHYSVSINGSRAFSDSAVLDALLVETNPAHGVAMGLRPVGEARHPRTRHLVFWVQRTAAVERILFAGNLRAWDWMEVAMLRIADFYQRMPEELLGMSDTLNRIKDVEKKYPGLISEGLRSDFITTARFTEILQELVREGLGIRNFRSIVEAVATYCSSYGLTLVNEGEFDLHDIVGYVRLQRKRQLLADLLSAHGALRVVSISPEVEEILADATFEGHHLPLDLQRDTFQRLRQGLRRVTEPVLDRGVLPVVLVCPTELRHRIISFLRFAEYPLRVLTEQEVDPRQLVEPIGVWHLGPA